MIGSSEILVLGTKAVNKTALASQLRPEQILIDLVNIEKEQRLSERPGYEGICW